MQLPCQTPQRPISNPSHPHTLETTGLLSTQLWRHLLELRQSEHNQQMNPTEQKIPQTNLESPTKLPRRNPPKNPPPRFAHENGPMPQEDR